MGKVWSMEEGLRKAAGSEVMADWGTGLETALGDGEIRVRRNVWRGQ